MATSLKITAPSALTQITLIDDRLRSVKSGFGLLQAKVQPGAYKVRFENAGAVVDKLITVERDHPEMTVDTADLNAVNFEFGSSAPLSNTLFHHEYHSNPARDLSLQTSVRMGYGAEILIFVRDEFTSERYPHPAQGLFLWNPQDGNVVLNLSENSGGEQSFSPSQESWSGLTIETSPGVKVLRNLLNDGKVISIPIYACNEFQTQVFLVRKRIGQRTIIDFDTAAIFMSPREAGFNFEDRNVQLTALALRLLTQKLSSSRIQQIGESLEPEITTMLREKFRNPMLGLFAAHIIIRDEEAIYKHKDLLKEVATNLSRLFQYAQPDVIAFKCALREADWWKEVIVSPPYLKNSLRILALESLNDASIFPYYDGGPCADVASTQVGSGPWLTWLKEKQNSRNLIEVTDFDRAAWDVLLTTIEEKNITDPADFIMVTRDFRTEILSEAVRTIVEEFSVPSIFAIKTLERLIEKIDRSNYRYSYKKDEHNWMEQF